jgi:hypothetical protein
MGGRQPFESATGSICAVPYKRAARWSRLFRWQSKK